MGAIALGLAFSILFSLLLCEGVSRVYEYVACVPQSGAFNRFDRFYGWGNRHGIHGWTCGCVRGQKEFWIDVSVNAQGLRGPEVDVRRTDAARILVLGDSFTAGMQVDDAAVYSRRLEERLNARRGRRVEVVNAGVDGWGTDNALLFWQREGWRYAPDLVVLAFDTTNDVFENSRRLVSLHPFWPDKPYATLRAGVMRIENDPLPPLRPTRRLATDAASVLARHSALFRVLASKDVFPRRMFLFPPPIPPRDAVDGVLGDIYRVEYPEVWTEAWRLTRGLILRLRQEVERRGGRFAVVVINAREEIVPERWNLMVGVFPTLQGVALDRDKANRLITRFLRRRGIPTIELLPAFRARFPEGPPGFFAWNMHWAPSGHALAAEVIANGIERQHLLP